MNDPSSLWCWDSNPQPLEHESSPITTRPELEMGDLSPSLEVNYVQIAFKQFYAKFFIESPLYVQ